MSTFDFFKELKLYKQSGAANPSWNKNERWKITRCQTSYILRGNVAIPSVDTQREISVRSFRLA